MLFPYLLKVSFLLAILTLSYRWLIKYETFSKINRILLFLNVVAAWSLPFIPLAGWGPVDMQNEFHQNIPVVAKTLPTVFPPNALKISSRLNTGTVVSRWALENLFVYAYLLGVLIMSIRLLYQLKGVFHKVWSLPSEKLGKRLRLIRDVNSTSPYSFFGWIICNPDKHSPEQLQHILAHETEHARQWHSLDLLVAELQRTLLWFNPFAWFHQRLVQENLEYMADHAVLQNGFERKRYQFSLVNVALRTSELPLTNSFAQSLLKKRIKMMNRKPSKYWVSGKYALLIALLYVSSAFVAHYKDRIIKLSPSIAKPLMNAILPENKKVPEMSVGLDKSPITVKTNEVPQAATTPAQQVNPNLDSARMITKGILIRNDTLYWAISALTTWDELNEIRQKIKEYGAEMNINSIEYDPLRLFITSLVLQIKTKAGGTGYGMRKEDKFSPIKGYSGIITKGRQSMGQIPPVLITDYLTADYQKALDLQKENEIQYLELNGTTKIFLNARTSGYTKSSLEGLYSGKILEFRGIGKSPENTLRVTQMYDGAQLYLNGKISSLPELNALSFEKLDNVKIIEDINGKKGIQVSTQ